MPNDASNVSAGKPRPEGALFVDFSGTAPAPTDAKTALAAGFANLGYASDAGLTNSISIDTQDVKAWGGDTVMTVETSYKETFTFNLIESNSKDVLRLVFGDDNVEDIGDLRVVKHTSLEREYMPFVFDLILSANKIRRLYVPAAKITSIGDISYTDGAAIAYPVTIDCRPDTNGVTAYEFTEEATG